MVSYRGGLSARRFSLSFRQEFRNLICVPECVLGWSLFGSNLYKVVFHRQTVDRAEQMCADLSARLVQVDSLEENKFLYTMLDINRDIYPNSEYWVGNKVATTGGRPGD